MSKDIDDVISFEEYCRRANEKDKQKESIITKIYNNLVGRKLDKDSFCIEGNNINCSGIYPRGGCSG